MTWRQYSKNISILLNGSKNGTLADFPLDDHGTDDSLRGHEEVPIAMAISVACI